jgi:hypothetical protein
MSLNYRRYLPGSDGFVGVFLFLIQIQEQIITVASTAVATGSAVAKILPVLFLVDPVNEKE